MSVMLAKPTASIIEPDIKRIFLNNFSMGMVLMDFKNVLGSRWNSLPHVEWLNG